MKWKAVQIGAVTKIVSGSTPKSGNPAFWGGSIPWATPTDLSGLETKELSATGRKITKEGYESCSANMLPARSVLFSSRAPIGLVAINKEPVCTNQGFKSFVPDTARLSSDFLYWWLKCNRASLEHLGRGATFKEVSKSIIETVEIPLPPLDEQKRIAAILDAADALRAKRRQSIAQLDALIQSTFLDLFGDPVTNPMGWDDSTLLSNMAEIVSGVTKGRKLNGKNAREIPYLAVANVQDKHLKLDAVKSIEATDEEIEKYRLLKNDLLLTEGGDPDKLGRGSLWNDGLPVCIHQNHIFRVRIISTNIIPIYLNWLIGSQRGKKYFLRSAKQTTGIASINMTQLKAFPMLTPPLPLQQKFAAIVESIERQKTTQRAHLAELDALFAALQHRAFRGEL
jgi:type I restriction enzyme S subunit